MSEELLPTTKGKLKIDVRVQADNSIINAVTGLPFSLGTGSGGALTIETDPTYGKVIHFNKSWIYDNTLFSTSPKGKDFILQAKLRINSTYCVPARIGSIVGYYKGVEFVVPQGLVIASSSGGGWAATSLHPSPYPSGVASTDWVDYQAQKTGSLYQSTINGYTPYAPENIPALNTYAEDVPLGIVIGENVYAPGGNWYLSSFRLYVND